MGFVVNASTMLVACFLFVNFKLAFCQEQQQIDIQQIFWADLERLSQCGIGGLRNKSAEPEQARILHGKAVSENEKWPWMAYMYLKKEGRIDGFICGGTLVDTQWILTAAHCVTLYNQPEAYMIVLGENDITKTSGFEKTIGVSKIIRHKDFDPIDLTDDIALMKLTTPVKYSDHIRAACIPPSGFETDATEGDRSLAGESCTALGWGMTEFSMKSGVLRKINLNIMPRILCIFATSGENAKLYIASIQKKSTQFCALGLHGGDTCNGDSGGPLLCYNKNSHKYFVQGITSYGPSGECGQEQLPAIYTQVSKYHTWITDKMLG